MSEDDFPEDVDDNDDDEVVVLRESDTENGFKMDENQISSTFLANSSELSGVISSYNAFMYLNHASIDEIGRIHFDILSDYLPLALKEVLGFSNSDKLLEIEIELDDFSWKRTPLFLSMEHPIFKTRYFGSPIVRQVVNSFFSDFYKPRDFYKSASVLLSPPGRCDPEKVKELTRLGFEASRAENALTLYRNNLNNALEFLRTGLGPVVENEIGISYSECPLLYLVLEIVEVFLDLPDHCCICRKELVDSGVKPITCDNPMCIYAYTELGVGSSVYNEIARDPLAADLVLSMFSSAIGTKYLKPAPPDFTKEALTDLVRKAPSMEEIVTTAKCDDDISKKFGSSLLTLLRWVLLTNRSQFISLNDELAIKDFKDKKCKMFMALSATPAKEAAFRKLQQEYNSIYLWHGSRSERWHTIFRNGLKNLSGTSDMANAQVFGPGIYLARNSSSSLQYVSNTSPNLYKKSALGDLEIIALCEVAKVDDLKDNGWNHTIRREDAVIIRFLIQSFNKTIDVIDHPPKDIPTLREVLIYHASHSSANKL